MLPGRVDGVDVCIDCSELNEYTSLRCGTCGDEAERARNGSCYKCCVEQDLNEILHPSEPPDLRLKRLVTVLARNPRPASIYTWMRGKEANALLTQIGDRSIELTHDAFDNYPNRAAADHLRAILEENGMVPRRLDDPQLLAFERWLEKRLEQLAVTPEVLQPIERFARWHHLRSLREKSPDHPNMNYAMRSAKQEITEAGKFLFWLRDEHGLPFSAASQLHVDEYVANGPSTRRHIRNFLQYANREWPGRRLRLAARLAKSRPMIPEDRRIDQIRSFMTRETIERTHRLQGLIFLLYGVSISRIAALTIDDVTVSATGMSIQFAKYPAPVPDLLAPILWDYLLERRARTTTSKALFLSTRAGRGMSAEGIREALVRHGIEVQASRNATLAELTHTVNATVLAMTLSYGSSTMLRHARHSGSPYSSYAAARTNGAATRSPESTA